MAVLELDYFEYATDEVAQAVYVTSGSPVYGSDLTGGETHTASSEYDVDHTATKAFDNIPSDWWSDDADTAWIQCQFASGVDIRKLTMEVGVFAGWYERAPRKFTLKASNTGAFGGEEVTLLTVDESGTYWTHNGEVKTWTFANGNTYTYYRINMTDKQGDFGKAVEYGLNEIEMMEVTGIELQCYSEDTIIQQGSYSLKVVAAQTGSLNDTLTKSGLSIDLSGRDELKLYVRSDRTGSNIQARLYDSVGGWITKDVNVTSTGSFIEVDVDISGVADANKSNITKIEFKILNADSDTIYYIDNFYAPVVIVGNAILFGINF